MQILVEILMMVTRNRNRSFSRILVVAIALMLAVGLFCGTGAAATNMDWTSYSGATTGDITITDAGGSTLSHKTTLTISQDAVLDFGDAKTYTLTGSTSGNGCGGLVDTLVFSDASKVLTIKNLHIMSSGVINSSDYGIGGLFGRIQSAGKLILENCSIDGVTIGSPSGSYGVGGLVGYAYSASLNIEMRNSTIENCIISSGSNGVGGLVGNAYSASVNMTGCVVNGSEIKAGSSSVGGLVGCAISASVMNMSECKVSFSNVTSSSNIVGGLVGCAISASLNLSGCMVDRVYVSGSDRVGGLAGGAYSASLNLSGCVVNGSEIKAGSDNVGGLVGYASSASMNLSGCKVEECKVWSSGSHYVGGLVGCANSASVMNMSGCMVEECTVWSSGSYSVGGLVGCANSVSIGFIGDRCWVNESWVSGTYDIGSLVGYSSSTLSPLVAPQHSAVYSASTTTGSSAIANNDFDGIGTKEQYGSPIDRYGLVAGKDYGYISYKSGVVASGTCGANLTWVLSDDGTLTISGTGAMYDYSWGTAPWYQYRSQMTKLVISDSVTMIGDCAFESCWFTGELILPHSVMTIGNYSFCGCSGFTGDLIIPDSVTTIGNGSFSGCNEFRGKLSIGNHVRSIGCDAFSGCGCIGDLIIPDSVCSIGDGAFGYCGGFIGNLTIGNSVRSIGDLAFCECYGFTGNLSIGNNVVSIGRKAFQSCSGFTGELIIPNSVREIGEYAFCGCHGFGGNLTIGNNVTTIGNYAFLWCRGFTGELIIPESVSAIGERAFESNGFIGSLTIPSNVTTIGAAAFADCSNLSVITVEVTNQNYSSDGQGILYNYNQSLLICCPAGKTGSIIIPNSVTIIGSSAFMGCSGITGSLTIPNSVTTIGYCAFEYCNGFTGSLTIPNSVTSIGYFAFWGCSGFTGSLTIPNSVSSIGWGAFMDCSGFSGSLTIPESITTIDSSAFRGCSGFTGSLTIPKNVTAIYYYAFDGCSGFNGSLTISNSVTEIDEYAFRECSGITGSLVIPNGVKIIGECAFEGCSGITNVTLPSSVTSICSEAFAYLHENSVIYADCPANLVSGKYSTDRTALAAKGTDNAYTFTVDSTYFPSGFSLTSENAPVKENSTFAGWYATPSYSGSAVSTVADGQTLYAKWSGGADGLQLYAGWNVVSTPKKLSSAYDTAAELFADVNTTGHAVLSYNSSTKSWEQVTASTKIEPLNAYWIYSNASKNLPYEFSSTVSSPAVKRVYAGWNAVSLSADEPMSAAEAFGNINWYTYLEWNAASQAFKSALIKGGSGEHADTNLVSLWTGGWLFLNEDGTYMGFTA